MGRLKKLTLVILGPQGSGKGTQAQMIAEKLTMKHFEMGQALRKAKEKGDEFGEKVAGIVDAGNYVPEWMIKKVLENYFSEKKRTRIIFDGVPRTLKQSELFDKILSQNSLPKPWVISLILSKDISLKRLLKRGRTDDTRQIIENRLKNHHELTGPVIERYRQLGRLIEIDGEPAMAKVARTIFDELETKRIN